MVKMRTDESVTTSLRELAELEELREQEKKRAHAQALQAAERARQIAEIEARQAEEARRREEQRLADERVRLAREEASRRAAAHEATLEETRHRLRLQEAEALHRQTLESTKALREARNDGRKQFAGGLGLGALLTVAGASALLFGYALPRASRAEAQVHTLTLDQQAAEGRAQRDAERMARLELELGRLRTQRDKALEDLLTLQLTRSKEPGVDPRAPSATPRTKKTDTPCLEGDPLCGKIGH